MILRTIKIAGFRRLDRHLVVTWLLTTIIIAAVPGSARPAEQCGDGEVSMAEGCVASNEAAAELAEIVEAAIEKHDLKSAILAVKIGETEVITRAWGQSMTGVAATPEMHFRNGAIAIPYLTTALLQLHDDGVLDAQDKLAKWFPDYPKADQVTLEMLANCTSGYADYVKFLPIYDDVFRSWTAEELIEVGFSKPMVCDPGTCFAYAHTNFVILGEVLRKVTGKPAAVLLRERILDPLSLANTRSEDTAVIQEPVLHAFTSERGIYEDSTYWDPSWTLAHGAVMTTDIGDALATAVALGTGRLLSRESFERQLAPLTAKFKPMSEETYYGLGLVISNSWVLQTPSFGGYSAVIGYLPARKIAFAVTSTMGPKTPDERITNKLAAELAGFLAPDHPPKLP